MLTKRIIPCLDVKEGRVVKGVQFVGLRDAGDPVELAKKYCREGADELVFLDISASHEGRKIMIDVIERTAAHITIPFTVGGGIHSIEDMKRILRAGADKISLNTAAVLHPQLIQEGAAFFGSQCIVVAIDAKQTGSGRWEVFTHGGRKATGLDVLEWAKEVEKLGAGELLLTSMDDDGEKSGFGLELTSVVSTSVGIPVIASGGAGHVEHFLDVLTVGMADAALAASIFHYEETSIPAVKHFLTTKGVPVRYEREPNHRAAEI
ncbi:imidazole glycerol phosphate synthase subunit HisF [Brevibacillus laterosporus]|uniref:imidazole glycerol phosphate synthase subunit HisF n=1 Tax=Brevibacillus laterosporus TaxID=1465 RepID=UPI0035A5CB3F